MMDVHCPSCGRVLLGTRQLLAVTSGDAGIEVAYVCWCGRPGVELVRRATRAWRSPLRRASGNEPRPAGVGG